MQFKNLIDRFRAKRQQRTDKACEHGVFLDEICDQCVDEFVANFHLIKQSEPSLLPTGVTVSDLPIGRKDDSGKAPVVRGVIQYFPNALSAVAEVSAFGAKKYDWGNWRFVAEGFDRYTDALGRHIASESREDCDQESGLPHAAHAAWNALARLEFLLTKKL